MERLRPSFYFNPFSCLRTPEGSIAQCREALLHNYAQRPKFSEAGHRWLQLCILSFLLAMVSDHYQVLWCEITLVLLALLMTLPAAIMASIWWSLGMMKEDLDRGLL